MLSRELRERKIKLVNRQLYYADGALVNQGGEWVCLVSAVLPPFRKVLTILHELGHYEFHRDKYDYFHSGDNSAFEKQATAFAYAWLYKLYQDIFSEPNPLAYIAELIASDALLRPVFTLLYEFYGSRDDKLWVQKILEDDYFALVTVRGKLRSTNYLPFFTLENIYQSLCIKGRIDLYGTMNDAHCMHRTLDFSCPNFKLVVSPIYSRSPCRLQGFLISWNDEFKTAGLQFPYETKPPLYIDKYETLHSLYDQRCWIDFPTVA